MKIRHVVAALSAAVTMVMTGPSYVSAAANPYEHGPAPTEESVKAQTGPFAIAEDKVSGGNGFGNGTIYYPKDEPGRFGGIVMAPGFVSPELLVQGYGKTLASHGFVIMTIDTYTPLDPPDVRVAQLQAGLNYIVEKASVKDKIDPTRLGLMGHSMGGGGTLEAAGKLPDLKAAIPLAPWKLDYSAPKTVKAATLIVGADNDFIAPAGAFAEPFYNSLGSQNKAYLKLKNAGHTGSFLGYNPTITKYAVSWLKRFLDNDTRYEQFLCPLPTPNDKIAAYQGVCPLI